MDSKGIMESKTIWVNLVAALALFVQNQFGFVLTPEIQLLILSGINIILRFFFTKKEVKLKKST